MLKIGDTIKKECDFAKLDEKGMLIQIDGKLGIKDISSMKGIYDIPAIYDEIVNVDSYETTIDKHKFLDHTVGAITLVRKANKWGAYTYLLDKKVKYREKTDFIIATEFVNVAKLDTLFDKIEVFYVDKKHVEIFFKVYLSGKCGIYSIYHNKFITPIVFDEIESCSNIHSKSWSIIGKINNQDVMYDGKIFTKLEKINVNYNQEYNNIRLLLKK